MSLREEIDALAAAARNGVLRAEEVVDWARANPGSALYRHFEWDDAEAAQQYRIFQARRLIVMNVSREDGMRKLVSLTIDRTNGGGYRALMAVAADNDLRAVLLRDALAELRRIRRKYRQIEELAKVFAEIDAVGDDERPQKQSA